MTINPSDVPPDASPRAAMMAAIFLTLAGFYGVVHGVQSMSAPRTIDVAAESDAELREAMHAIQANPYSGALGASNIVVSVMLMVASMLISMRRASAMWFVRQAIVANLLFIFARGAVEMHYLWSLGSSLDPIGRVAYERAQSWVQSPGSPPDFTTMTRSGMLFGQLFNGALSGGFHLFLGYKATRPAVRSFVETAERSR